MNINWFPGHMKKTKEQIIKDIKLVDLVIEIIDSRIPISSSNPMLNEVIASKPKIVILNKCDLANPRETDLWMNYFLNKGVLPIAMQANTNKDIKELLALIQKVSPSKKNNDSMQTERNIPVRAMIVGIPNSGKSTLINTLSNKKGAKTGNRPGVTKSTQWIKVNDGFHLLDTPGILWPKFDEQMGLSLAFTGAIKDEILDVETLSLLLVEKLLKIDLNLLIKRFNINIEDTSTALEIMENIARKRGCISRGDNIDYTKVANIILNEFRSGVIGLVTLERVADYE